MKFGKNLSKVDIFPHREDRAAFTYSRSDQPMGATDLQKGDYYGVHAESSKPLATTWHIISTP